MKHRLLALLATCLLLTGCTTTTEMPEPASAPQSTSTPDMSVPSWKVGDGWVSRYILAQRDGRPLECVVYTQGGITCNWNPQNR
ncbi:hypothetical protein FYJ24_09445 [Actinomycetaceae bacterium WB03_NA08]|uniref:Uncharacterized protein n=1 Tax=Scrofimicrobium canadense TaxID=2652290 RepID=A0A6N7W919_9ACTO|nr:hypothetical protein [Scrofimicrobium canadense]MSS84983.1 hypothetical protein [Scrofimicrobium canadense]